jgi:hypothetical protein
MKITIPVTLNLEHFENVIITALEGGSNYWCKVGVPVDVELKRTNERGDSLCFTEALSLAVFSDKNFYFEVYDCQNGRKMGKVNQSSMKKGLRKAAKECPIIFSRFLEGQSDASDADVLFQFAAFGHIIYG